ncbi:tyrosine-type recombinase/integrase [Vibrio parahaemolyticus]|uniref:tyrosine-type recombinase/integrase n=1 Tax=Vibrio parahaemolyticus TaxID=670 RepID=UPI00387B7B9B
MYLLKSPSGTYYTRLCLPKSLKIRGFPFDIKASLLTKERHIANYRNALIVAKLHPIVHNTPDATSLGEFNRQVSDIIDEVRDCFDSPSTPIQPRKPRQRKVSPPIYRDLLTQTLDSFIESKKLQNLTHLSLSQLQKRCEYFIAKMAVKTVQEVSLAVANRYVDELLRDGRSNKTNREYLAAISQFFKWCVSREIILSNPFTGVELPKTLKKPSEERERWSSKDLKRLFSDAHFQQAEEQIQLAVSLILHHGTRPAEICQLSMSDVILDAEVPYLNICQESEKQHLKNVNSKRMVPIHHAVLRDGRLQKWFSKRKASNQTQLFDFKPLGPDLDWSKQLCTKFGKIQTAMGWKAKQRPTLYGMRHTFIDELKKADVPEHVVAQIVGHSYTNLTFGRYGKSLSLSELVASTNTFRL